METTNNMSHIDTSDLMCQRVISIDDQVPKQHEYRATVVDNVLTHMTQVVDVTPQLTAAYTEDNVIHLNNPHNLLSTVTGPIQYVVVQQQPADYDKVFQPISDGHLLDITQVPPPLQAAPVKLIEEPSRTNHANGMDSFQCGLCNGVFENLLEFLQHKATHVKRGMGLGCEMCGLVFSRQLSMMEHYRRKHKIHFVEKVNNTSNKTTDKQSSPNSVKQKSKSSLHKMQKSEQISAISKSKTSNNEEMVEVLVVKTEYQETETESLGVIKTILTDDFKDKRLIELKNSKNYSQQPALAFGMESLSCAVDVKMETENTDYNHVVNTNESGTKNDQHEREESADLEDDNSVDTIEILQNKHIDDGVIENKHPETLQIQELGTVLLPDAQMNNEDKLNKPAIYTPNISIVESPSVMYTAQRVSNTQVYGRAVQSLLKTPKPVQIMVNLPKSSEKENSDISANFSPDKSTNGTNYETEIIHEDISRSNETNMVMRKRKKLPQLSDATNTLSMELDMPDFHFISCVESTPKTGINGGKFQFVCLYCNLKVNWRSTMCRHMREKHEDMLKIDLYFSIAPPILPNDQKLMKMSDYIKLERDQNNSKRIRGVEKQDLPGDFPCNKCGKMFHRLRYLRKHELVHKSEKNLLCSVCVKSFKSAANLNQHMKTHKNRESYKCSECDFQSTINIAIHTHRQLHSKGCVLCDVCGSAYSDKSTLTKHKLVHDLRRPFACHFPGCTWRFKTKFMCNAHYRAHTTKGEFECKVCSYAFRQKHHLQRHQKKVHGILPEKRPSYDFYEPVRIDYTTNNETDTHNLTSPDKNNVDGIDNELDANDNELDEEEIDEAETEGMTTEIHEVESGHVDEHFDLEAALQNGQLVVETEDGNTIPVSYEISDMGMSVAYHTLLPEGDTQQFDGHTILIPQSDGSHIMYQQEEVTETITTET